MAGVNDPDWFNDVFVQRRRPGEDGFVDIGPEPTGDRLIPPHEARLKFKDFIREFRQKGSYVYRHKLLANCAAGNRFLDVCLEDLQYWSESGKMLVNALREQPTLYVQEMERCLDEVERELRECDTEKHTVAGPLGSIQLQINSDTNATPIRGLTSRVVEKLVVINGIVIQASAPGSKTQRLKVQCRSCGRDRDVICNPGRGGAFVPRVCDGGRIDNAERCPSDSWIPVVEKCGYWFQQSIKLQEFPEDVPVGEMPRHIELYASRKLVDKVLPGTRLTVTGVLATSDKDGRKNGDSRKVKSMYVNVLGLKSEEEGFTRGSKRLSNEEEEEFRELSRDPELRTRLYSSIAPSIFTSKNDCLADVKKAIACLLFGGSRKKLPDQTALRGDINVLLLGDPGTAKSQFLKFVERAAPIAVYTSGKGSSAAGLTAAILRDKEGNFALEGGAMVRADGGVTCIDEFDKMRPDDRVAIHEAMEQQTISNAKAGITTVLNTRCSVLAAANPIFGSWDETQDAGNQMDFASTILSRFDLIFLVKDVRDEERDRTLAYHVMSLHTKGDVQDLPQEGEIPTAKLRKYLMYMRKTCSPRISPAAADVLENHYTAIRAQLRKERAAGAGSTIPITVRQLEALARITESLAKMEGMDEASVAHVDEAIRLFTAATLDAANRHQMGEALSEDARKEMQQAEDQIKRRIPLGGRKDRTTLINELTRDNINPRAANSALHNLLRSGDLVQRGDFSIVRKK
jgi:DNA replication licensing factor MCM5